MGPELAEGGVVGPELAVRGVVRPELAESACWTRQRPCSAPWKRARPRSPSWSQATGLARPTAHRIAVALERHRLLARDSQGRFVLGPRITELAAAAGRTGMLAVAQPVLARCATDRGKRAALPAAGDSRICVAAAERASGLRDTVPVGGGAADDRGLGRAGAAGLGGARAAAPRAARRQVLRHRPGPGRRRGWAASVAEREAGVASVSAPVRGPGREDHRRGVGVRPDRAADPVAGPAARRRRGHRRGPDQRRAPPRPAKADHETSSSTASVPLRLPEPASPRPGESGGEVSRPYWSAE